VALSPDVEILALGFEETVLDTGVALLYELKTRRTRRLNLDAQLLQALVFSPDGRTLAAGTNDGYLILCPVESQDD